LRPNAVLKRPEVLASRAERPNAVLENPPETLRSAFVPPAVFPEASLSVGFGGPPSARLWRQRTKLAVRISREMALFTGTS
jgi:hypothetical protein